MTTLTTNQQQLIDQITQEFISHNQSKRASRGESLLGVDDIINSVQRKREEIARIKAENKASLEAIKPVFEENFEALSHELNALGLLLKSNHEWSTTYDGRTFISMEVAMRHDSRSDLDFYFDAQLPSQYIKFDGNVLSEVRVCKPTLLYNFRDNIYTFEQLCKHPEFIARIKRMYEIKAK